jgi:hypothetical protein
MCVREATPYFDDGVQQGRSHDGEFAPGTTLRAIDPTDPPANMRVVGPNNHKTSVDGTNLKVVRRAADCRRVESGAGKD